MTVLAEDSRARRLQGDLGITLEDLTRLDHSAARALQDVLAMCPPEPARTSPLLPPTCLDTGATMAEPGKVVTEQQILDDIINSRGGPGAFTTIDLAVARALVGVLVQVGNGDASKKASSIATLTEMLPPRTEAPPEKRQDLSVLSDKEVPHP